MTASTIHLRDRRQITLPAEVVAAVGLSTDDALDVSVVEGRIVLVPRRSAQNPARSMSRFVGAGRGAFGQTAAEADALVRDLRDEW